MDRTSIPCDDETRDKLKQLKDKSGKQWDPFLQDLADSYTSTDDNSKQLSYDDIRQACESALRNELPERVFQ